MGYYSDVRITMSNESFEIFEKKYKELIEKNQIKHNMLEFMTVNTIGAYQRHFGWDFLKWYGNEVECIMESLEYIEEQDMDFTLVRLGSEFDDIEIIESTKKPKEIYAPFVEVRFDDAALEELILTDKCEHLNTNEKNDISKKIALGAGYYFAIVNDNDVSKDIKLYDTEVKINKDGVIYDLYKGNTFNDSRLIDNILDKYENFKISEYEVKLKKKDVMK